MDAATRNRGARAAKAPSRQPLQYLSGFGNEFATEALPGALPVGRNSPQRCAYGLYAEQISSTAFTALRGANRRSWTYRIRPAAMHEPFKRISDGTMLGAVDGAEIPPTQMRWSPLPLPKKATDFVAGLFTMAHAGDPLSLAGGSIHMYAANRSMKDRFFYDADGELLIVPQLGRLHLFTEMGQLMVEPQEIAVIPRGVRFRVELPDVKDEGGALEGVRGYICENYGASFRLPDLGPIGSNGLANPRDFLAPVAWYEDVTGSFELVAKFQGRMWAAKIGHSPLDVVAWHGNSTPYKYDLRRFNTIGSISYDHPDPSIFLVLQSQSAVPGVDAIDFVIFPPRWLAGEDTFRPPWFHRNIASEFMGLVHGQYDAKAEGFLPGGASLHSCMTGHGPDQGTFEKASAIDTSRPAKVQDTMAFMFETPAMIVPTRQALELPTLQREYWKCWQGLTRNFDPSRR